MAPYYKKFHTFFPASKETNELLSLDSYMNSEIQGTDGPLSTTFPDAYGPFNQAWMAAFNGVGFNDNSDPILGRKLGAFTPPNSVDPKKNQRSYSASAYYTAEIERRPNLDLLTETFVNKVLLQSSDNGVEAKGVQICSKDGSVDEIYAEEVILAAGALQSPQILENSGIGSKEILKRYGVEILIDNPGVGENLQDHCFATVSFEVSDDQISADVVRDPAVVKALLKQYEETRTGPLSGVPFSLAYLPPVDINGRMAPKDVELLTEAHIDLKDPNLPPAKKAQFAELQSMILDPSESTCFYGLMPSQMHIQPEGKTSMSQAYSQQRPENFISIMVGLNHPLSRGSVHIGGSNPKSSPLIDPGYLSHPLDVEILARGTQFIEKIANQQAMKQLLKTDHRLPSLAAHLADLASAKQVMKDRLWTSYHPSCTCAMMPQEIGGVVNDRLVVHGTKNVRVIDASVFPMITLGNIQATVYAVAERASDLIKEDWAGRGG
jgi:choline dehydrogenase-like flavoprotein